jgi:hypothetical protein
MQIWDQQPGESDRDYAAFQILLSCGHGATLTAVARLDGRSRPFISRLAKNFNWKERSEAFWATLGDDAPRHVESRKTPSGPIAHHIRNSTLQQMRRTADPSMVAFHLHKISEYQVRSERLGNAQVSIAGQLFQIVQEQITAYREQPKGAKHRALPSNIDRLLSAASKAAVAGHQLVGEALGIEQLFIVLQDRLSSVDAVPAADPASRH